MIQRPNYLSPYQHPKRALERRNLVLDSMVDTGAITRDEAERAKATPLKLATPMSKPATRLTLSIWSRTNCRRSSPKKS